MALDIGRCIPFRAEELRRRHAVETVCKKVLEELVPASEVVQQQDTLDLGERGKNVLMPAMVRVAGVLELWKNDVDEECEEQLSPGLAGKLPLHYRHALP